MLKEMKTRSQMCKRNQNKDEEEHVENSDTTPCDVETKEETVEISTDSGLPPSIYITLYCSYATLIAVILSFLIHVGLDCYRNYAG